jgi:PAS domain S-box-containing protein
MNEQIDRYTRQITRKSDQLINYFLIGFFVIGLLLAFYYDTWLIAIGVGGLSLVSYYSAKIALPNSDLYQYVLSIVIGIFMAQFIYQMHGMFEMHFFAFIGSAILITYRNWKLQIPLALVVVVHHALFGYLQFIGFEGIYFTQLEYMAIETFIIHGLLATIIFLLCGFWADNFKKSAEKHISQSYEIGKLQEANSQKEILFAISENLRETNAQLQYANKELSTIFNKIDEVLFSVDLVEKKVIQMSVASEKVYGYTPAEFLDDVYLLRKIIHPADVSIIENNEMLLRNKKSSLSQYRIIQKNHSIRWVEAKLVPTFEDDVLIRVDGIVKDITDKIILEDQLADERKQKQQEMTEAVIIAQENQRTFLGEELHDNINPLLATIKLYMDCAITDETKRVSLIQESKGFVVSAIEEIRILSKSLVTPSLGATGLQEALTDMIETINRVNNLPIITKWKKLDEELLDEKLKLTIFRIVQEQLTNIFKHAKANQVIITLEQTGLLLHLSIKDDGAGFDTKQKRKGVGIQNIISRAELCNGKVSVISEPGSGCELMVDFGNALSYKLSKAS